jgi:Flp pilus assembly protein TadG
MNMKNARHGEHGQVLVIAALLMTALVGFLALVVDVGNAYAQRRYMQNAADAAAMAATRYMALNRAGGASDAGVASAINTYLANNGGAESLGSPNGKTSNAWYVQGDGSTVSPVGNGGGIPSSAVGVKVNASKSVSTYFARVLGVSNIGVNAAGAAAYGTPSKILLNWKITGTPMMPIAFGLDAWKKCSQNYGYGGTITFAQPIDYASDCSIDNVAHFGFTTLNIASDCSNNTTKTILNEIVNNPAALGTLSVWIGDPILVCSGSRDTTWNYIMQIGKPFIVPIISEADAQACNSNCNPKIIGYGYMRANTLGGNGSNTYIVGTWVDPATQPPLTGLSLSSTSSVIPGPVTYTLFQ